MKEEAVYCCYIGKVVLVLHEGRNSKTTMRFELTSERQIIIISKKNFKFFFF